MFITNQTLHNLALQFPARTYRGHIVHNLAYWIFLLKSSSGQYYRILSRQFGRGSRGGLQNFFLRNCIHFFPVANSDAEDDLCIDFH